MANSAKSLLPPVILVVLTIFAWAFAIGTYGRPILTDRWGLCIDLRDV